MRQIATIPDEQQAATFGDYLLTLGIENTVEESSAGWAVWVHHDDHLDKAREEFSQFQASPADPRYDRAAKAAGALRRAKDRKAERLQRQYIDTRTRWASTTEWHVPLTLMLIIGSCIVAVFTRLGAQDRQGNFAPLVEWLVLAPHSGLIDIRHGEVWRLVTPIFLHFTILHLVFNMLWLRDLGGMIERQRGTWRLLGIVVASAILSNLAQYAWEVFRHGALTLDYAGGMSGVVYALFGYAWIKGRIQPQLGVGTNSTTVWLMMIWLFLCMTGWIGPIANAAHVGGLVTGVAMAYIPYAWRQLRRN